MSESKESKLWLTYWATAWHKKPAVKVFSLYRAVPSLLIAVVQFFVNRQNRPVKEVWIASTVIIGAYFVLYVIEAGFNTVVRSPALIDKQKTNRIEELGSQRVGLENNAKEISQVLESRIIGFQNQVAEKDQEIARLKSLPVKPKRTDFEEKEYQTIKHVVGGYGEEEKNLLRHLLRHGKLTNHFSMGVRPLPAGLNHGSAAALLNKLSSHQLLTSEHHNVPGGWETSWQIAPGASLVLKELL